MSDIVSASLASQPVFFNSAELAWEQKLQLAYNEATLHLKNAVPAGTLIDASKYELAADAAGSQIQQYGDVWTPTVAAASENPSLNVDPSTALKLDSEQSRQFYLGQYAQASANLGAYLTGAARAGITQGVMTQEDFDNGAFLRLRQFSTIIHAGRTGKLSPLVGGEAYAQQMGLSPGGLVLVANGQSVVTPATGVQGLGGWQVVVIVGVIAGLTIAGITLGWKYLSESEKTRRQALDICQQAIARGDPKADLICQNMADHVATTGSIANKIIPPETQSKIVNWLVIGAGAYLAIQFAPEIIKSLSEAKRTYARERDYNERLSQVQVANLARFARHARRRSGW